MDLHKIINNIAVIIISLIYITIAGIFLYKHDDMSADKKNPLYFALGIALASKGAHILINTTQSYILPEQINDQIIKLKD